MRGRGAWARRVVERIASDRPDSFMAHGRFSGSEYSALVPGKNERDRLSTRLRALESGELFADWGTLEELDRLSDQLGLKGDALLDWLVARSAGTDIDHAFIRGRLRTTFPERFALVVPETKSSR